MTARKGEDFIFSLVYLYFLLFKRVFSALLEAAKSTRGSKNCVRRRTDAFPFLYFPLRHISPFPLYHLVS